MSVVHRRQFLTLAGAAASAALVPASVRAAVRTPPQWAKLVAKAEAAMDQYSVKLRDRFVVVDFSLPSAAARMLLVDRESGLHRVLTVAHGRGSDPAHSGFLHSFSNAPGSNASSRGAYLTGAHYTGQHGRSQRLIGLETSNDNAESRAIVIHGAWYSNDDMVKRLGKLGRSEGCFAVSETQINPLLDWLGPGRMLYADKV
ncbi:MULTISPECIES: murein L,D-transpeptidase catalytic domain family protein [unclassified Sphingobium]|uniref:murein L,D-transpeptidase catalytic domain family protein n=1 Tax=unclassified Sphingobium TaxID=2611147 RepID=UPI002224EC4F|nr:MULTISPECIES: murein L,D-transpeptidase catalytic domain family protein [unclassified Sphingobium]MCW2410356.1 hypothetical protein [Sphingobium sp. B8D3D]MCW2413952.1 hypothetical protein [Sphingobium sp. B8D3A]